MFERKVRTPSAGSAPLSDLRQNPGTLRQRALTFSTLFGACLVPFLVVVPGFLPCPVPGAFLDASFPMCRESTALAIRNAPFSTGCFFIISSGSSPNTRAGSSGTMVISGRSSRTSSSATSTVATPAAVLPASAVRTVARGGC